LTKRQKQSGITGMVLMHSHGFGITLADLKFQKARLTPIRSKRITLNYVTILHASLAKHVVFLVVFMPSNVPYACLFIVSIAGSFINNIFQIILLMSWISSALSFSHSVSHEVFILHLFLWYNQCL
jgi:hypothetical protein